MKTVVHLSDLHFGALDERLLTPLREAIERAAPDLVAVSGDLTQRARRRQFEAARAFLTSLRRPLLVVPGNHDIPLYDLALRFTAPLDRYRKYVSRDLAPVYSDDEMIVVGLNSVRTLSFKHGDGRLNQRQVAAASERLARASPSLIKIVVTHHPFDLPAGYAEHRLIGRARLAMPELAAVGTDVFLAGHLHVSHVGRTAERYQIAGHSALVIQAGTMSRRGRGELNSFNVLRLAPRRLEIERCGWAESTGEFTRAWTDSYERTDGGWTARTAEVQ